VKRIDRRKKVILIALRERGTGATVSSVILSPCLRFGRISMLNAVRPGISSDQPGATAFEQLDEGGLFSALGSALQLWANGYRKVAASQLGSIAHTFHLAVTRHERAAAFRDAR
jgi:hypothetical protein